MPALFLYLLKANLALCLLYGLYHFAFRKLTFYTLNRLYLLGSILFAAVYPVLEVDFFPAKQAVLPSAFTQLGRHWPSVTEQEADTASLSIWTVLAYLFYAGVLLMAGRLLLQFASLYQLHKGSAPAQLHQFRFRQVREPINPFSFGKAIYLHPPQHTPEALPFILQHEAVHVRQLHSLDVLLTELLLIIAWYNPLAWHLQKALKENLEFLTDEAVVKAGFNKKEYQYTLLRALSPSSLSLVSPFHVVPLKNRILMMNKTPSKSAHLLKLLLVPPALATLLFLSGNQVLGHASLPSFPQEAPAPAQTSGQDEYQAFLKRNPTVKGLGWQQDNVLIFLKSGKADKYPNTPAGLTQVEKKYGALPSPPPPPPAAPPAPPAPNAPDAPQVPPPPPPFFDAPKEFVKQNPTVKGLTNDSKYTYVLYKSGEVEKFPATAEGKAAFKKKFGILPPPPLPVQKSKH